MTPLHLAVTGHQVQTARLLIRNDPALMHKDEDGYTPLYRSIEDDHYDAGIFEMFCSEHALDLTHESYRDNPLIFHALKQKKVDVDVVRSLLAKDPEIAKFKSVNGTSAVIFAVQGGRMDSLSELVNYIDVKSCLLGGSPLLCRILQDMPNDANEVPVIQKILNLGADVNGVGPRGQTALYKAAWLGRVGTVTCLLEAGADPNICDEEGISPLQAGADLPEIIDALVLRGAPVDHVERKLGWTALMRAVHWNSEAGIRALLKHKANINIASFRGSTALHLALSSALITRILLENSANANAADEMGWTPLHYIVMYSKERVSGAQDLLERGAELRCKTSDGYTPLHIASMTAHAEAFVEMVVEKYRQRGLSVDEKDNIEESPLHLALSSGSANMVNILVDNGASLTKRDGYGRSCLALAAAGPEGKSKLELVLRSSDGRDGSPPPPWSLEEKTVAFIRALSGDRDAGEMLREEFKEIFERRDDAFVDEDGWTVDQHLIHYNNEKPISGPSRTASESATVLLTPTRLMIPVYPKASSEAEEVVTWSPNHMQVQFQNHERALSVRADHAFPPQGISGALYYFEVEVMMGETATESLPLTVGIGLCGEFADMAYGFPGWYSRSPSIGYHSDDGWVFDSSFGREGQENVGQPGKLDSGKTYGVGDTVGCGIDWADASVYYTVNGELVGRYRSPVIYKKMYPVVSVQRSAVTLRVNFGASADGEGSSFKFGPLT
ncbi:ankyrin repeat-containing domain protein [Hypoxylon sp. FL1284]|nr:ankyrin repeat-containing domain protein [Hypoxylon sp. FL1284]